MSKTIEKVTLRQFKGLDREFTLGPLTLLVGPNSTGKTSVIEAIRYGITGATSAGATADACMKLMSAAGGSVRMEVSGGPAWRRGLQKDLKTRKVSGALVVDGQTDKTLRELDAYIAERCGDYAPAFNLAEFTGLSPDKRRDHVVQLCARHSTTRLDADVLAKRFTDAFLDIELGEATCDAIKRAGGGPMAELGTSRSVALRNAVGELLAVLTGSDTPTAVAEALDRAKAMSNASKRQAEEGRQAGRKLSERKADLGVVAESVDVLEAKMADARKSMGDVGHQLGRSAAQAEHKALLERRVRDEAAAIEAIKLDIHAVNGSLQKSLEDEPDALRAEADDLLVKCPEPSREAVDAANAARVAAVTAQAEADGKYQQAVREVQSAELAVKRLSDQLKSAESEPLVQIRRWAQHIVDVLEGDEASLKAGEAIAFANCIITLCDECEAPDPVEIAGHRDAATEHVHRCTMLCGAARIEAENAAHRKAQASTDAVEADHAYRNALQLHEAARSRARQLQERSTSIASQRQYNEKLKAAKEHQLAEREQSLADARTQLATLQADMSTATAEELKAQRAGLETVIRDLEIAITSRRKLTTLEAEYAACIASAEREELMHDVCKQLADAIRSVREELMAEMVRPLVGRIERFLSAALGTEAHIAVDLESDRGKAVFDLHWLFPFQGSHRRVPLEALGGGEAALFNAALAFALVDLSGSPLKLLMIEAAELDDLRLPMLMRACAQCCGDFANVILATCHHPDFVFATAEHGDWRVINTEQLAEVAA